jgi:hypothetical protein
MTGEELRGAAEQLHMLHADAMRAVHSDHEAMQMIARVSFTLGEMRAPLNAMRDHLKARPDDAQMEKDNG